MEIKMKSLKHLLYISAIAGTIFVSSPVLAEIHVVEMLNKGEEGMMVFKPAVVFAEAGDTVQFKPTDKSHNVVSFNDMLPEGVESFKSKFNKEFELVVDKEGTYGYYCQPHLPLGMVGLIVVGDNIDITAVNLSSKAKGKAKKRLEKYIQEGALKDRG